MLRAKNLRETISDKRQDRTGLGVVENSSSLAKVGLARVFQKVKNPSSLS
jgi:hypothetical protein